MSNSRERRERAKLWLIEHVVELRRYTAERARRAVWTVVAKQLHELVIDDIGAADGLRREERVGSLCRRQRRVSPPLGHERKHVVEERNVRDRSDFAIRVTVSHERVDGVVVAQS